MIKKIKIAILYYFFFLLINNLYSQSFEYDEDFIEGPLIFAHETSLKGIIKITPIGKDFAKYSSIELSKINKNIIDPQKWLTDKIYDDIGDVAETERVLNSKDSPFSDPIFEQFKNVPLYIEDTLAQLSMNPLVFCKNTKKKYNKAGVFFELNCTIPFGFFSKYLILRIQYSNNVWYFKKIYSFNYNRLQDLLIIAETFSTN